MKTLGLVICCFLSHFSWAQGSRAEEAVLGQYLLSVPYEKNTAAWVQELLGDNRITKDTTTNWQGMGRLILFGYIKTAELPFLNADSVKLQLSEQKAQRQLTVNGLRKTPDSVRYYQYVTTYIFDSSRFNAQSWKAFVDSHLKILSKKFEWLNLTITPQQGNLSTAIFGNGGLRPLLNLVWWEEKKSKQYRLSFFMSLYEQ